MSPAKSVSRSTKRNVPLARLREDCDRRFHDRFGRPFSEADRRRLLEDLDSPATAREARGRMMFLAVVRDRSAMATGNPADASEPIGNLDLAVLLVLLGFVERKGSNVTQLLDRERATFAKLRKKYDQLREQLQIPGASASDVTGAFETWAEHGFATATGPKMLASLAAQGLAPSEHRPGKTKLDLAQDVLDDLKALAHRRTRRLS